jgi:hypothetical protein
MQPVLKYMYNVGVYAYGNLYCANGWGQEFELLIWSWMGFLYVHLQTFNLCVLFLALCKKANNINILKPVKAQVAQPMF